MPASIPAATLVVTNQANSGPGTLRTLLPTAQNGDVITFAVTGAITNILSGGLPITHNLSIVGPGANLLTITGTNWFPAFTVSSGATTSISGLTFDRCYPAIQNSGNLSVSNCIFSNNRGMNGGVSFANGASGYPGNGGAAIYNVGALTAVNCQFLHNIAGAGAFGMPSHGYESTGSYTTGGNGAAGGNGGAIYDLGTANFWNCTFGWNAAGPGGAGGLGNSGTGSYSTSLGHSISSGPGFAGGNGGNGGNGGAVFSANGAQFVGCTFFGNTAGNAGNGGDGGSAYLTSGFYGAYPGGNGGSGGNAGGGTLYSTGACQLVACTFYQNSAGAGGSAGSGGNGSADFNNVNAGPGGSGGNAGSGGSGGAIFGPRDSGTNFFLQNVLLANNTCGYAGSPGSAGSSGGAHLTGPAGTNGISAADGSGPDLSGAFTSRGHNLVSLGDGGIGLTNNVQGDLVGSGAPIDALLTDLADNHGPVPTCALQPGSPALDAGDDSLLLSPTNLLADARGYSRKSGSHVDIGAYEFQWPVWPIKFAGAVTPDGAIFTFTNTPGATFTVMSATDLTTDIATWDVLGPVTEVAPGQFQWTDPDSANHDFRFFTVRNPL